jgi:hypothetical protein
MVTYRIKKGRHRSLSLPRITLANQILVRCAIKFDFNFLICEAASDYHPVHKLTGLSDNISHHKDSIRIGWNIRDGNLILYTITYMVGTRRIEELRNMGKVEFIQHTGQCIPIHFIVRICIFDDCYFVELWDSDDDGLLERLVIRSIDRTSKWGLPRLVLKPYYGGTQVAPEDIEFEMEYL